MLVHASQQSPIHTNRYGPGNSNVNFYAVVLDGFASYAASATIVFYMAGNLRNKMLG